MLVYFWVVASCASFFAAVVLLRNNAVYRERTRIISELFALAHADIDSGNFYGNWRREIYLTGPGYEEMVLKFWRPVDSFFPPVSEWRQDEQPTASSAGSK